MAGSGPTLDGREGRVSTSRATISTLVGSECRWLGVALLSMGERVGLPGPSLLQWLGSGWRWWRGGRSGWDWPYSRWEGSDTSRASHLYSSGWGRCGGGGGEGIEVAASGPTLDGRESRATRAIPTPVAGDGVERG